MVLNGKKIKIIAICCYFIIIFIFNTKHLSAIEVADLENINKQSEDMKSVLNMVNNANVNKNTIDNQENQDTRDSQLQRLSNITQNKENNSQKQDNINLLNNLKPENIKNNLNKIQENTSNIKSIINQIDTSQVNDKKNGNEKKEKTVIFDIENFRNDIKSFDLKLLNSYYNIIDNPKDKSLIDKALSKKERESYNLLNQRNKMFSGNKLSFNSLFFFDKNKWQANINNIKFDEQSNLDVTNEISIVSVDKKSILFLITNKNDKRLDLVKKIINGKYNYFESYNILNIDDENYIVFKLYAGQKVDLESMLIYD